MKHYLLFSLISASALSATPEDDLRDATAHFADTRWGTTNGSEHGGAHAAGLGDGLV